MSIRKRKNTTTIVLVNKLKGFSHTLSSYAAVYFWVGQLCNPYLKSTIFDVNKCTVRFIWLQLLSTLDVLLRRGGRSDLVLLFEMPCSFELNELVFEVLTIHQ